MYLSTLLLSLLTLSPALALPSVVQRGQTLAVPTPTLPFTLAAFQSPFPPGSNNSLSAGVSGVRVRAFGDSLWVNPYDQTPRTDCGTLTGAKCPPGNQTVLWVDAYGGAWLDSEPPQPVYLNTQTGVLSFLPSGSCAFPAGANAVNFLHLGQGTSVTTPIPGSPGYANAGTGTFQWTGSSNSFWFLCPRPGPGYQVMKFVGGYENWNACVVVQLIALDYSGPSPAAGEYI